MDLQLPGIDGHAALELLRADAATAGIPVVAVTAFAMRRDRERALDGRASTATSRSRSASASSPTQVRRHLRADARAP